MYASFLEKMRTAYKADKIQGLISLLLCSTLHFKHSIFFSADGRFGAMMNVSLTNEVWYYFKMFVLNLIISVGARDVYP
jgi:D-Tyr-tRNAtyr deacylase